MSKKKSSDGGSFDFDDLVKEEGIQKGKDLANQQANYRSIFYRFTNARLCNR